MADLPEPARKKGRRTTRGSVPPVRPVVSRPEPVHDEPDWRIEGPDPVGGGRDWDQPEIPVFAASGGDELDGLTEAERQLFKKSVDEIAKRKAESLRLFNPMPEQERAFASNAGERIFLGGNRGGKTTAACIEIARATTGQDPYDKYPKENGKCILVGRDLKHCSKVFFDKLFNKGAFKVIRDLHTGEWRSFQPQHPDDIMRPDQAKDSPPLIPKRLYTRDSIAWENKKDQIPTTVRLKNGWEIYFFSAMGTIPQGWAVHVVVFDEEIENDGWYKEMAARLLDHRQVNPITGHVRGGKFIWAATPQAGTQRLYALCSRAERDLEAAAEMLARGETPTRMAIEVFRFGLLDNEYMSRAAINELIAKYEDDPEEYEVRIKGNFALLGTRVYGEFMEKGLHCCEAIEIGSDWTRYMAIDPGYQVCAVLFAAVPPPEHAMHGQKVIYDELYIRKASGAVVAARILEKIGYHSIHKIFIDHKAGGQHDFTSGNTNEQNYTDAFKKAGVACEATGSNFSWVSSDVKAGIEKVRQGLQIVDGRSEWIVIRDKSKWFREEISRYSYKRNPDGRPTDEPMKSHDHLMDCWRYLALANLRWIRPQIKKRKLGYTSEALRKKKERAAHKAKQMGEGGIKVG